MFHVQYHQYGFLTPLKIGDNAYLHTENTEVTIVEMHCTVFEGGKHELMFQCKDKDGRTYHARDYELITDMERYSDWLNRGRAF